MINQIHNMDALELLKQLPDNYINCVVTSPPYYALRDYNVAGQIGLEETPAEFVAKLVAVFREIRRVLREDGVAFVNMGDSYVGSGAGGVNPIGETGQRKGRGNDGSQYSVGSVDGLPPKNRLGMPHRLVFALQDDGWIWRDEVIWHKPNPMPESVTDRTTKAHEYVFMLTKRPRYWYDADAIREEAVNGVNRGTYLGGTERLRKANIVSGGFIKSDEGVEKKYTENRNRRSVFTVPTEPTPFAHFATYPQALIEPLILAGCPAKVCAVCGAPHVRVVEDDPQYAKIKETMKGQTHTANEVEYGKGVSYGKDKARVSKLINTVGFTPTCTCAAETRAGIVYDPFMGSGTTAIVARRLNRQYIGSELNPEYAALANKRLAKDDTVVQMEIKNGVEQLSIFDVLPSAPDNR